MSVTKLEKDMEQIKRRIKRVEEELELSATLDPLDWTSFTEFQKKILAVLLKKKREGATTTEIAQELKMPNPNATGRVLVYRDLNRIIFISKKSKGAPIVVSEKKKWRMNYEEFTFAEPKKGKEE